MAFHKGCDGTSCRKYAVAKYASMCDVCGEVIAVGQEFGWLTQHQRNAMLRVTKDELSALHTAELDKQKEAGTFFHVNALFGYAGTSIVRT